MVIRRSRVSNTATESPGPKATFSAAWNSPGPLPTRPIWPTKAPVDENARGRSPLPPCVTTNPPAGDRNRPFGRSAIGWSTVPSTTITGSPISTRQPEQTGVAAIRTVRTGLVWCESPAATNTSPATANRVFTGSSDGNRYGRSGFLSLVFDQFGPQRLSRARTKGQGDTQQAWKYSDGRQPHRLGGGGKRVLGHEAARQVQRTYRATWSRNWNRRPLPPVLLPAGDLPTPARQRSRGFHQPNELGPIPFPILAPRAPGGRQHA